MYSSPETHRISTVRNTDVHDYYIVSDIGQKDVGLSVGVPLYPRVGGEKFRGGARLSLHT